MSQVDSKPESKPKDVTTKLTLGDQVFDVPVRAFFIEGSTRIRYIIAQSEEAAKEIAQSIVPEGKGFVVGISKKMPAKGTPVIIEQLPIQFDLEKHVPIKKDVDEARRRVRNYAIGPLD